uniref:Reverse transcriptase domain-containing protein n=3 Tax=Leptobrachium leishanense TaxID=445787 RepID=A0A8C5PKM6_9ANUR
MATVPRTLKVLSINAKGLNIPEKRHAALREFTSLHADVVLVQETHFSHARPPSFKNHKYPIGYFSNATAGRVCGTAVLFSRSTPFSNPTSLLDPAGRYTFVKGQIGAQWYTFVSIYLPNRQQHSAIRSIFHQLQDFQEGILVVGGDLNLPLDARLDTSRGVTSTPHTVLRRTRTALHSLRLMDCWRSLFPSARDYTYYSAPHQLYTRLDYIFLPFGSMHLLESATIGPMTWSDHCPVLITLSSPLARPREKLWRLNESLLTDPQIKEGLQDALQNYFKENDTPDCSPQIIWETHKAVIRGYLIQQGARRKRERTAEQESLLQRIAVLERSHKLHFDDDTYAELLDLRSQLRSLFNNRAQKAFLTVRKTFHEHGNKCGRLLANALRTHRQALYVTHLRTPQGPTVTLPKDMLGLFHDYYTKLYGLHTTPDQTAPDTTQRFLRTHLRSKLTPHMRSSIEGPITAEELHEAIKRTPVGKTPGPDGFTLKYYKICEKLLSRAWLASFNGLTEPASHLTPQSLSATITLIPKPDKDHALCANYRPISLLNQDVKLFAKVLALRLANHMRHLIHPDQTGFIPGREGRDNTTLAINLIHAAQKPGAGPTLLLSTDAEKAFDRVHWPFLFQTLHHMGFGPNALRWITALYDSPTARINLNGTLSPPFNIKNGTRQGCPLSPLLFALSLEPLLQAIRANPSIHGVGVGRHTHKVAAYADDLLFFVQQPQISLPSLIELLREYGSLSNYKINMSKSEILNISIPAPLSTHIQSTFPFRWCTSSLKYLGVHLTPAVSNLYVTNFVPLLRVLEKDLTRWAIPHITWFGRINVLKMNVLPRVLYLLQTLPVHVPTAFFRSLQSLFIRYVWAGRKPRLRVALLTAPRSRGGLALPHLQRYYQAVHLLRLVEWSLGASGKQWVALEHELVGRSLTSLPWLIGTTALTDIPTHPTVSVTMAIWRRLQRSTRLAPWPSPLLPLNHLPAFSPRLLPLPDAALTQTPLPGLYIDGDRPKAPKDIPLTHPDSFLTIFHMHCLITYLRSLAPLDKYTRPLTAFEQVITRRTLPQHGISTMYGILQNLSPTTPLYVAKWESDLHQTFTEEEWDQMFALSTRCSIATRTQETAYKLLSRWYRAPITIATYSDTADASCWRCGSQRADLLHIWWSCPVLQPFWTLVHDAISKVSDTPPSFTPAAMLLHHTPLPVDTYRNTLDIRLLNAAKAVIPRHWKSAIAPTFREWLDEVQRTRDVEDLLHQSSGTTAKHLRRWYYWSTPASTPP